MRTAASSLAISRATTDSTDSWIMPRVRRTKKLPPVVYLHGAASDATESLGFITPAVRSFLFALARHGFTVVAPSAPGAWGNTSAMNKLSDVLALARSELNASGEPPVILGASHGGAWAIKAADTFPVAGLVLFIPAVHLQAIRETNPINLNQRAVIDAAWGVTYPEPLPPGAEVFDRDISNTPAIINYAPDDPISIDIQDFATRNGAALYSVGNLGHSNEAVEAVPIERVGDFVLSVV